MQINAYNNLLASVSAEFIKAAQTDKNADTENLSPVAELGKGFGGLIEKALNVPDDRNAVAAARLALAEGRLESQEAFETAAKNILNCGI